MELPPSNREAQPHCSKHVAQHQFLLHQHALYSSQPSALHELAVKCIGHYLLATKEKALILHPTNSFKLDMFVDADFAGMWHHEYS